MFFGNIVALVTPMLANREIDFERLKRLVDFHIAAGTKAIVACGTTGEAATLTDAEQLQVIQTVTEHANGRIAVIAGTGANATRKTINLTRAAMESGVDACLIVTPYYNKPTQEGLFQHYKAIADNVPVPQILYNVPSRTCVDLLPETVARLANISNIIGIKEATGSLQRAKDIFQLCGERLDIYSGEDKTGLDLMLEAHAKGIISVTANVVPDKMAAMCNKVADKEFDDAEKINEELIPLHSALFLESNPIPVKWALYKMNFIENALRLPLTTLSLEHQSVLETALQKLQIAIN